jgi:hypothetical protein
VSRYSFQKIEGRIDLLKGIASKEQVTNAFSVYTYAKYKSYIFQADKLDLNMIDRGWYDIWVPVGEIESIWEERKESGYNLPFPENIEKRKEITFPDI